MIRTRFFIMTGAAALAAGCAITPPEEAREAARASLPPAPAAWSAETPNGGAVQVGWIRTFEDPALEALVAEAQEKNKDLQLAASLVERSAALARQAGAALVPQVSLGATASESGLLDSPVGSQTGYNAGLQLGWELDIWGRIRAGRQAAGLSAEAFAAFYDYGQDLLAATVARAYFTAIEASLQERVARETYDALEETARIVKVQYDNGLASSQDLALTRSDFATARDRVAATEGAKRNALRALEELLGRYPGADIALRDALPPTPPPPPAGAPAELLERRPDVIAAERRVAASFNALDAAKAARLPTISLTSEVGGASNELTNLLDPANVAWTVAGNLAAPLFDGGARQAQVEISKAEQKQAIAGYGQSALRAFKDVETQLDQGVVLADRLAALEAAAAEAREAYRVARLRYDEGETDLIDVLTIQQRVFNADSNLVSIRRQLLEQRVNLNLALGGGWN